MSKIRTFLIFYTKKFYAETRTDNDGTSVPEFEIMDVSKIKSYEQLVKTSGPPSFQFLNFSFFFF